MAERIFLIDSDDRLQSMEEQPYEREDVLQGLLARYPDLIPGDQVDSDEPRKWLLVKREMEVPDTEEAGGRWSLDHLFLDQDGIPTFVETKRSSDTRLRREVLGQMLDYAANSVAYWSAETLRTMFEQRCSREQSDCATELARVTAGDPEEFWGRVKTNLEASRLRLVFVADAIPRELRRIIEFLNEQMTSVEVIGVEIRQFLARDGRRTIVPRVIGQTEKAQQRKSGSPRQAVTWTEDAFFEKISQSRGPESAEVARKLLRWAEEHADRVAWNNSARGSFVATITGSEHENYVFLVGGEGVVELEFMWESRKKPFSDEQKRRQWLTRLNRIPGVRIAEKSLTGLPNIPLKTLANASAYDIFVETSKWALEEIRRALRD